MGKNTMKERLNILKNGNPANIKSVFCCQCADPEIVPIGTGIIQTFGDAIAIAKEHIKKCHDYSGLIAVHAADNCVFIAKGLPNTIEVVSSEAYEKEAYSMESTENRTTISCHICNMDVTTPLSMDYAMKSAIQHVKDNHRGAAYIHGDDGDSLINIYEPFPEDEGDITVERYPANMSKSYIKNGEECTIKNDDNNQSVEFDPVNRPKHYIKNGMECMDWIKMALTPEEFAGYLKGCALKYIWRYEDKGHPAQDLQKSRYYLNVLAEETLEK